MTPEYLLELADLADPDKLWRLPLFDQLELPPEKRRQLDAGVALRRYSSHLDRLRALLDSDRSLLITPLSLSGLAIKTVPTPASHKRLISKETT